MTFVSETFPRHDEPWLPFLNDYAASGIAAARESIDRVASAGADALGEWNGAQIALGAVQSLASTLSEVHPDAEVRSRASEILTEGKLLGMSWLQDPHLYAALGGVNAAALDAEAARALALSLEDFRLQGAHLDDATRSGLTELNKQIADAETAFAENIRESVGRVRVSPDRLAGLPDDFIAERPAGADGMVELTTAYPDLDPVLDMADDAALRAELLTAAYNRAYPENDRVLAELLDLRDQKARLLGFESFPDYAVATMMMPSGDGIGDFLADVNAAARPAGLRDVARLLERMQQDDPDATAVTVSDSRYYVEKLRAELHGVDAREVRSYLSYDKCLTGVLDVTARLFGLTYVPVDDAPRWHEDVLVFDVLEAVGGTAGSPAAGDVLGRIHLDMHPRDGKFSHMACFGVVPGFESRALPEGALVCNFGRGQITHDDLATFLHEFGHLIHLLVGGHGRFARLAALSDAGEWDFVEAPSQMLEEWAWNADVLRTFATNAAGDPIPEPLVERMRAARDLCEGLFTCRQLNYASLSYQLHRDHPSDVDAFAQKVELEYDVRRALPGTHQQASFGHLTDYSACYYTYQWSLSIAKDMFTAFDPSNLMDPTVARRYREKVLEPGGRKPAAELVADFLGRPYSTEAYQQWLASL